jgi:phosphinothricin acetyltransferase
VPGVSSIQARRDPEGEGNLTIHVRPSRDEDVAEIARIYEHAVRHGLATFEIEPPDAAEMARRRQTVIERGDPHLVAERGGRILGYAYAGPYRPRPAYRFTVEDSIYVAPEGKGNGVGRALLSALIAACEAKGYRQMIAVIGDSANDASIGLHAALGFARTGLLTAIGWKHGRWVDGVLMQRALGEGARAPPVG